MMQLTKVWLLCGWLDRHAWEIVPRMHGPRPTEWHLIEICRRCGVERTAR